MKPEQIKYAIYSKGFDLTMLSNVLDKSPSLISKVIHGKGRSYVVAEAVAKILEMSVSEVFPNQYDKYLGRAYKSSKVFQEKQEELRRILNQS
ncbi:MAG: helix-turn-helix domain-containing protein [Idiomarina sp.]|nr:helix-turn-helix domain-containing protein [Idiomarina sp.]